MAVLLARPRKGPLIAASWPITASALRPRQPPGLARKDRVGAAVARKHSVIGYIPDILYAPELHYLGEIAGAARPRPFLVDPGAAADDRGRGGVGVCPVSS